jgi:uncharacterized NAD-dependent epimerase/dehydratase family protein
MNSTAARCSGASVKRRPYESGERPAARRAAATPVGYFIAGTDTGVGKTHVTALLLAELRRQGVRAAAMKPIACGRDGRHDAEQFATLMFRGHISGFWN